MIAGGLDGVDDAIALTAQCSQLRPGAVAAAGEVGEHALAHGAGLAHHAAALLASALDLGLGLGDGLLAAARHLRCPAPRAPARRRACAARQQLSGLGVDLVAELLGVLVGLGPHLAGRLAGRGEDAGRLFAEPRGHRRLVELGPVRGAPGLELVAGRRLTLAGRRQLRRRGAGGRPGPRWDRTPAASW